MTDAMHIHRTPKKKPTPPPAPRKQGDAPICKICKEPIGRLEGEANAHWLKRKVCVPALDEKEVKCINHHINSTNKNRQNTRNRDRTKERIEYKKPIVVKVFYRTPKITQAEAERMDAKQREINKYADENALCRSQYANSNSAMILRRYGAQL